MRVAEKAPLSLSIDLDHSIACRVTVSVTFEEVRIGCHRLGLVFAAQSHRIQASMEIQSNGAGKAHLRWKREHMDSLAGQEADVSTRQMSSPIPFRPLRRRNRRSVRFVVAAPVSVEAGMYEVVKEYLKRLKAAHVILVDRTHVFHGALGDSMYAAGREEGLQFGRLPAERHSGYEQVRLRTGEAELVSIEEMREVLSQLTHREVSVSSEGHCQGPPAHLEQKGSCMDRLAQEVEVEIGRSCPHQRLRGEAEAQRIARPKKRKVEERHLEQSSTGEYIFRDLQGVALAEAGVPRRSFWAQGRVPWPVEYRLSGERRWKPVVEGQRDYCCFWEAAAVLAWWYPVEEQSCAPLASAVVQKPPADRKGTCTHPFCSQNSLLFPQSYPAAPGPASLNMAQQVAPAPIPMTKAGEVHMDSTGQKLL